MTEDGRYEVHILAFPVDSCVARFETAAEALDHMDELNALRRTDGNAHRYAAVDSENPHRWLERGEG